MKKYINKKSIIIASVMLLLLVAVGTTLAYIFTETKPVENTFNPSKVSCAVVENSNETEYTNSTVKTGNTKTSVQIKNTGDTDAYIRVAVVVNWMNEAGTKVWASKPVEGTEGDYTITYNPNNDWFNGGDGFYYYNTPISPDELTTELIESASLNSGITAPVGNDNTQYYLSIEIVASAIQSTPETVVENQWDVTVENGVITPKAIKEG